MASPDSTFLPFRSKPLTSLHPAVPKLLCRISGDPSVRTLWVVDVCTQLNKFKKRKEWFRFRQAGRVTFPPSDDIFEH